MNYFKSLAIVSACAFSFAACDSPNNTSTKTETTVLDKDTVDAETTYEVNEKVVEKVDTVGATTEYEVEKEMRKRTVKVDTITEEITREQQTDFAKGDYEVVDEEVEKETVTEEIETGS